MLKSAGFRIALGIGAAVLIAHTSTVSAHTQGWPRHKSFNRIAVFPVFKNTNIEIETVAEIVSASSDGMKLIYTDGKTNNIGFVDIYDPTKPKALGVVGLNGEPTSVAVSDDYALVAVNTSADFVNTSGELVVIDVSNQEIVATHPLDGQPDSIAVSQDGRYAAIAIENERDEDLGNGEPPQAPPGHLTIVDKEGSPANWTMRQVYFSGVPLLFPDDAEPEYVDINKRNQAVVTMQENNHIAVVDLKTGNIIRDFSAGSVNLEQVDTDEEDPALITLDKALTEVPREPDGVTWISNSRFATANEGDLFGGSRGFSIFKRNGRLKYDSGNSLEHLVVRLGHYPDDRSGNKGNEPENVAFGRYGFEKLLFVGSERSSVIAVYRINNPNRPKLQQVLPAGVGPEGLLAIPQRNLFVAASEVDDRGDKIRSVLNIYRRQRGSVDYPTIKSTDREDGTPIPWGALSGLAIDKQYARKAYTIHDSFYQQSRIYSIDLRRKPALINGETVLYDSLGKLAAIEPALVNQDTTVNLDQEGISTREDGGFWIASEGDDSPVFFRNLLIKVAENGLIEDVATLPASTTQRLIRFGFEGVTSVGSGDNEFVYVAFQREWADDPTNHVRIGRYEVAGGQWKFYYYPLESPTSPNGGWVGLSDLVHLSGDEFAIIERDNQAGLDATIKRIYKFSVAELTPLPDTPFGVEPSFPVLQKSLVRDLLPDLRATGGLVLEKIEGLAVDKNGNAMIVNDNDGVDDSNGETQLLRLHGLFK